MSDNEKPLDIAGIEARLAKATPGPWELRYLPDPLNDIVRCFYSVPEQEEFIDANNGEDGFEPSISILDEDAEFIANAPTDVAALLSEIHRLRRQLNQHAEQGHNQYAPDDLFFPPYPDEVGQ